MGEALTIARGSRRTEKHCTRLRNNTSRGANKHEWNYSPARMRFQVIPEDAVEAAWSDDSANPRRAISRAEIWAILEAAAPHMLEACWDAAAEAAIERERAYGSAEKSKYDNPYRPTP